MAKFIGTGAAGNKALAYLIEAGITKLDDCLMLNTATNDFPKDYSNICVLVGDGKGGCGKDRDLGREIYFESIKASKLDYLDDIIANDKDNEVFIIGSTEGGTGSGSVPVVADYFKTVHGSIVHIVAFTGFENDPRGLGNTVEFFKSLSEEYVVHVISNKKFIDEANGIVPVAEKLANRHLGRLLTVLLGHILVDSEQNIDERDLYNLRTTPGYAIVDIVEIPRDTKNIKMFNDLLVSVIDYTKAIAIEEPSAKRLGVILNVQEKNRHIIDFSFQPLKERLGFPYDFFPHIQDEDGSEFVGIIATGMDMPINEIKAIHTNYINSLNRVKTNKDSFLDSISSMKTENDRFKVTETKQKSDKSAFLNKYTDVKTENPNKQKFIDKF